MRDDWKAVVASWLATSRPPRARILVVDDSPLNAEATRAILEGRAHEVTIAGDGERALEVLRRATFDLVLMDIHLPGIDGLEATRRFRALEAFERRPRTAVVALTSSKSDASARACIAAGMDAHLDKPVCDASLTAIVAAFARRTS